MPGALDDSLKGIVEKIVWNNNIDKKTAVCFLREAGTPFLLV